MKDKRDPNYVYGYLPIREGEPPAVLAHHLQLIAEVEDAELMKEAMQEVEDFLAGKCE